MFQELMPLLAQRALCITVSRKAVDKICLNVIPKKLKEGENEALTTPLTVTGSPKELDERLSNILVEFVGNHLELSSNLRSASEQMRAAARKTKEVKEPAKGPTETNKDGNGERHQEIGDASASPTSEAPSNSASPASGRLFETS